MSIELSCPACGAVNAFAGDQAGRLGKCGECKTPVYLPLPQEMPPPSPSPNRKGPRLKTRRLDMAFLVAMLLAGVFLGAFGYHFGRPLMDRKSPGDKGGDKGTARPSPPAAPSLGIVDFANNNQAYVDGSIPEGQSSASFKFVAPRDGTMKVELTLRDNRSGTATEYDISAAEHVAGGSLAAAKMKVSFPVFLGGSYVVKVTPVQPPFGSVKGGNFTLSFRVEASPSINPPVGITPPPISPLLLGNSSFVSARDVFLFDGLAVVDGEISRIGEARYFRVHIDEGGWLKASFPNRDSVLNQGSLLDARLSVYNSDKIFLAGADQPTPVSRSQKYCYVKVEAEPVPRLNRLSVGKFAVNIRFSRVAPR